MKFTNTTAICYISWCGLGFIRGINSYKYTHNNETNKPFIYLNSIITGFAGYGIYACPPLIPILIYKELYRLEVNLRNLENEKNSQCYKHLLWF